MNLGRYSIAASIVVGPPAAEVGDNGLSFVGELETIFSSAPQSTARVPGDD